MLLCYQASVCCNNFINHFKKSHGLSELNWAGRCSWCGYIWLTLWLNYHRTVSSLLHSDASPAAFGAPLCWWWLSVMAATFCSSRHTCSRYFLRICRYELKALLEWKRRGFYYTSQWLYRATTFEMIMNEDIIPFLWYLPVSLREPSNLLPVVPPVWTVVRHSCVYWVMD